MVEEFSRIFLNRNLLKILKATILTAAMGFFFLLMWWFFVLRFLTDYPEIQMLFIVLVLASLFFTFVIKITEGTVYKYGFLVGRALFMIIYLIYATNEGIFTTTFDADFAKIRLVMDFVPLLALMVFLSILDITKSILQALEFVSESPRE